ncbi:MAG: hypothetical protein NTW26_05820 [bacterium]|nr:hypothetical protein [bacterium]
MFHRVDRSLLCDKNLLEEEGYWKSSRMFHREDRSLLCDNKHMVREGY